MGNPRVEEATESELWEEIAARHEPGESMSSTLHVINRMRPYLAGGRVQEHLYALLVDTRYVPIGEPELIAIGTLNQVESKPRDIFRLAITRNALGVFLAHNHPSDQHTPSQADIDFTALVMLMGEVLGVQVFDSLVITDHGFTSIGELISSGKAKPSDRAAAALAAMVNGKAVKEIETQ